MRSLFNSAFKANPYLERAILTGVTRVSKESIFSDLNNLDEEIGFHQLDEKENAVWSLLLACGYLKVIDYQLNGRKTVYTLGNVNYETQEMLEQLFTEWFAAGCERALSKRIRGQRPESNSFLS